MELPTRQGEELPNAMPIVPRTRKMTRKMTRMGGRGRGAKERRVEGAMDINRQLTTMTMMKRWKMKKKRMWSGQGRTRRGGLRSRVMKMTTDLKR